MPASRADEQAASLAAAANDETVLTSKLQGGVSPNALAPFQMRFQYMGQNAGTPQSTLPLLMIATQSGSLQCVKLLLDAHADPNSKVNYPMLGETTALDQCFAFQRSIARPSFLDAAHLLIEARADINALKRDPDGCTELMTACQDGEMAEARFLLDHGADHALCKTNGATALFKAAQNGHVDACRILICAHATVDARFSSGATPLGVAAAGGHEAIVRLLLSAGADATVVACDDMTPSDMAGQGGHRATVALLAKPLVDAPSAVLAPGTRVTLLGLQAKPELNGQLATVLEFDRTTGRYSTALHSGKDIALKPANVAPAGDDAAVDVTDDGGALAAAAAAAASPAARTAATPVRPSEVWALLNNTGCSILWACDLIRRRDFDLMHPFPTPANQAASGPTTHLLAFAGGMMRKKDPNGSHDPSNIEGMPEVLQALLESRADANARTPGGAVALHLACSSCIHSNVAVLLEHRADVNCPDGEGAPPLMMAMQESRLLTDEARVRCIGALASTGQLEIDRRDSSGYTSFMAAVEWGRGAAVLHALLSHGASVNAQTLHEGFTPLAAACAGNTRVAPSIVKLLLEAKADVSTPFKLPSAPTSSKQTARAWASAQGRAEVVAILDACCDFDQLVQRAIESNLESSVDALTDRIASGDISEAQAARQLKDELDATSSRLRRKEVRERGAALFRLIRLALRGADLATLVEEVASSVVTSPRPEAEAPTAGGRCCLQGLKGAPRLNGQNGRVVQWNPDGKRRYSVRLDGTGKLISCQMRNVVAVDTEKAAFPHDFNCTSAEFAAALQAELRQAGSKRVVLDWTPLVAAVSDVVQLLHMMHDLGLVSTVASMASMVEEEDGELAAKAAAVRDESAAASDVILFVQSTPETAPFFLAHREFYGPASNMHATNIDELAALPWLCINETATMVPNHWARCCKKNDMVRLCVNMAGRTFTCPICHEERDFAQNPSQLPCAHFLCTDCLKRLVPTESVLDRLHNKPGEAKRGITCPVCRTNFPQHSLGEHAAAPGGVALFEHA